MKYSRQRTCILQYLQTHHNHPTAETVYQAVQEEYPNISLGTVYRNLTLLADMGIISRLTGGDGPDRFDANTKPHYHFHCTHCGDIIDLELEPADMEHINLLAMHHFDGIVEGHSTIFFGRCPHCAEVVPNKD